MIRNPSDGTTYTPPKPEVSGLPVENPKSTDEARRLEKSREWLKNYSSERIAPQSEENAA